MVSKKILDAVWARDKGMCAYSGVVSNRLVVHHRGNRGMGGSKSADGLANLVLIDSLLNGRFEADMQRAATSAGFKISKYAHPESIPLFHAAYQSWVLLDNEGGVKLLGDKPF